MTRALFACEVTPLPRPWLPTLQARDVIEGLEDVSRAEVHLSLATSQQVPSLKEIYMLSDETAPVFSDEPSSPVFISAGPKREFA